MIYYKSTSVTQRTVSDVLCNVCGKSLWLDSWGTPEDHIHVDQRWGYFSNRDRTRQQADICEECWDKFREGFAVPVEEEEYGL